ncbi:F-box family protein with DUF295, partial [Prunus dulcis]
DCCSADSVSPRPARIADQADYGPLHPARATRADLVSSRNLPRDQADHSPLISPICGSGRLRGARDLPGELTDMTGLFYTSFSDFSGIDIFIFDQLCNSIFSSVSPPNHSSEAPEVQSTRRRDLRRAVDERRHPPPGHP